MLAVVVVFVSWFIPTIDRCAARGELIEDSQLSAKIAVEAVSTLCKDRCERSLERSFDISASSGR